MDDLVEGVVRLMKNEETHPVNLGNAVEHTVREVADMVPQLSGGELTHEPLPADDPRRRRPDIVFGVGAEGSGT